MEEYVASFVDEFDEDGLRRNRRRKERRVRSGRELSGCARGASMTAERTATCGGALLQRFRKPVLQRDALAHIRLL